MDSLGPGHTAGCTSVNQNHLRTRGRCCHSYTTLTKNLEIACLLPVLWISLQYKQKLLITPNERGLEGKEPKGWDLSLCSFTRPQAILDVSFLAQIAVLSQFMNYFRCCFLLFCILPKQRCYICFIQNYQFRLTAKHQTSFEQLAELSSDLFLCISKMPLILLHLLM